METLQYWVPITANCWLETKYRDIADGNVRIWTSRSIFCGLETKYRDIADGNLVEGDSAHCVNPLVGNQVPRYSGWKPFALSIGKVANVIVVGNQVPRYSGWKRGRLTHRIGDV